MKQFFGLTAFLNRTPKPKPYQPPQLETHHFAAVVGVSLPIGSLGADPLNEFLEAPKDFLDRSQP
jgi:hypothetical protein